MPTDTMHTEDADRQFAAAALALEALALTAALVLSATLDSAAQALEAALALVRALALEAALAASLSGPGQSKQVKTAKTPNRSSRRAETYQLISGYSGGASGRRFGWF